MALGGNKLLPKLNDKAKKKNVEIEDSNIQINSGQISLGVTGLAATPLQIGGITASAILGKKNA